MTSKRFVILLFFSLCSLGILATDSISGWNRFVDKLTNLRFLIVPVPSFAPETNWSFGLGGSYYYHCKGRPRMSDLSFEGAYTLNQQWYVSLTNTTYFGGNNQWFMYSKAGYRNYPDYYYQPNTSTQYDVTRWGYTSNNVYLQLQPQRHITSDWIVGANTHLFYDKAIFNEHTSETLQIGLGAIVSYDSRDNLFYPAKGLFLKLIGSYYAECLPKTYGEAGYGNISLDFRHFVTLYKELIFAYQLKGEAAIGNNIPFQMQPTIGGGDWIRGIRSGQYRNDAAVGLQAELRFPIYSILRGTAFWGIGDAYDMHNWQWTTPKMGYGLGLRLQFNKNKINVRFDVAHDYIKEKYTADSKYNYWRDGFSFYLTVKEAF